MTWHDATVLQEAHIAQGPDCTCGCPRGVHRNRTKTPGLKVYDGLCSVCLHDEHTYTPVGISYIELSNREFALEKEALAWPEKPLIERAKRRWFSRSR